MAVVSAVAAAKEVAAEAGAAEGTGKWVAAEMVALEAADKGDLAIRQLQPPRMPMHGIATMRRWRWHWPSVWLHTAILAMVHSSRRASLRGS